MFDRPINPSGSLTRSDGSGDTSLTDITIPDSDTPCNKKCLYRACKIIAVIGIILCGVIITAGT